MFRSSSPLFVSRSALALTLLSACDASTSSDEVVARAGHCSPPLAGVASASGHWAGGSADRAFDGDPATWWLSNQSSGAWLALDLGAPRLVDHVRVQWRWDFNYGATATSVIETSLDGVTWTPAATTTRERQACIDGLAACTAPEDLGFAPVLARHVRLRAVQWNGGWGHVQELSVHEPCAVCTADQCAGVFVLDEHERRAVVVDADDSTITLDKDHAQRLCTFKGKPKLQPGTLLLAGPRPEVVASVDERDPAVWNNAFGFARELVAIDCASAPVTITTTAARLDRAQYALSSARVVSDESQIVPRPPAGPEPKKPTGTFIPLGDDATPVGLDIVDIGPPPTTGAPPMPPILPPVPASTGLNACTTPQPLEFAEGEPLEDPEGFLPPKQWVIQPKVIQGDHELAAEAKVTLEGEVRMQVEPCIDLDLDPAGGTAGHIGFNVRYGGRLRGKYEGKGVYKRKFALAPDAIDDDFLASAISRDLARKHVFGMWVLWVPTPAGVPLPVVIRAYPVLEVEVSAGGKAELETTLTARGVHFAGVRVAPQAGATTVTPYYGGNLDTSLTAESDGVEAVAEVRANLKLEFEVALLDSLAAKAALIGYASAEQTSKGTCGECQLELGAEGMVAIGGRLPLGLAPEVGWEVEWTLYKQPFLDEKFPGNCSTVLGAAVPGLDPQTGLYPVEPDPVDVPRRCPFPGFVAHGPADAQGRTTCGYPHHWPYVPRPDLWGDAPGKQHIMDGYQPRPEVEQLLVEVWMQAMGPSGTNLVSMAPHRGYPGSTQCTPWFFANASDPTCPPPNVTVDDPVKLDFVVDAPGKPVQKWLRVPQPADGLGPVSYLGDFLDYHASYFNVRVVGVKWDDGDVQYAEGLEYCEGHTAPVPPPAP